MSKVTVVPVRFFQMHLRFGSIFRIKTNEIFPKVYLLPFFSLASRLDIDLNHKYSPEARATSDCLTGGSKACRQTPDQC